jgi:hypothetical protein
MRKLSLALTALLALVLPAVPASAGAPTDQLRKQVDQVVRVLDNPALKEKSARHDAVRKIAGEVFDYNEMAKRALGTIESQFRLARRLVRAVALETFVRKNGLNITRKTDRRIGSPCCREHHAGENQLSPAASTPRPCQSCGPPGVGNQIERPSTPPSGPPGL